MMNLAYLGPLVGKMQGGGWIGVCGRGPTFATSNSMHFSIALLVMQLALGWRGNFIINGWCVEVRMGRMGGG